MCCRPAPWPSLAAEHPSGHWDARRFRPNILFDDGGVAGAHGEDGWIGSDLLVAGKIRVFIVAPTPRCPMPTLEQADLGRDLEILRTIARVNRRPLGEFGRFACVGAFAEMVTAGVVGIGDEVAVVPSTAETSVLAETMAGIAASMRGGGG